VGFAFAMAKMNAKQSLSRRSPATVL